MTKRTLFLIILLASPAAATEWDSFGPKAMAMGGTGVALPQGALSSYWNPAGLGLKDNATAGVQLPVGAHYAVAGPMIQGANDLHQIASDCESRGAGFGSCSQANINQALITMNTPESGLRADGGGGAQIKIKHITVFANDLVYTSLVPRMDLVNTSLAAISAGANQSQIIARTIAVSELGAGYGQELPFAPGLYVGGNLKLMIGRVSYYAYFLDSQTSPTMRDYTQGAEKSVQPGVDLGLLWDVNKTFSAVPLHPRLGLTGRNINDPKFDQPGTAKVAGEPNRYALQGQTRAGLALTPIHFWNVTADMDVVPNQTRIDGVLSQTAGIGTEINVFNRSWINLPLRAGLSRNVAQKGAKTDLSAGFGLHFMHVYFDTAVMASPAKQELQTQGKSVLVPTELGISAQLAVLFGGAAK
jgi:hypothetical protein